MTSLNHSQKKVKTGSPSFLADNKCRLYHLQGSDVSLSASVCSLINCFCSLLFKCVQTRPQHNNAPTLKTEQTTGRNKKHGLLISNLALGEQGLHTLDRGQLLCATHTHTKVL